MKKWIWFLLILFLIGGAAAYYGYKAIYGPNVSVDEENQLLRIPSGTTYNELVDLLTSKKIVKDKGSFELVSKLMKYEDAKINSGQYKVEDGWSNKQLISTLRAGRQHPVKVTFNNLRKIENVAAQISSYLEIDSATLAEYFVAPETLESIDLDKQNAITLFIPNTYEMYWDASKEEVVERFRKEHQKFWKSNQRLEKAKKLGLSQAEVYTLASIVEKESLRNDEKETIAGVYLNRIKYGMPLQADPTVVFALEKFDLRRVLNKHLEFDSPYNTYLYAGLPPGPIYMPSISSIDGVLNYDGHPYLYFCANPDQPGGHLFAASLSEHNRNAARYHRWLNSRGIR